MGQNTAVVMHTSGERVLKKARKKIIEDAQQNMCLSAEFYFVQYIEKKRIPMELSFTEYVIPGLLLLRTKGCVFLHAGRGLLLGWFFVVT